MFRQVSWCDPVIYYSMVPNIRRLSHAQTKPILNMLTIRSSHLTRPISLLKQKKKDETITCVHNFYYLDFLYYFFDRRANVQSDLWNTQVERVRRRTQCKRRSLVDQFLTFVRDLDPIITMETIDSKLISKYGQLAVFSGHPLVFKEIQNSFSRRIYLNDRSCMQLF